MSDFFHEYFTKISSESSKCRYCPSKISTKGGSTWGLERHLETKHFLMYLEEIKPKLDAQKNGNDDNAINYVALLGSVYDQYYNKIAPGSSKCRYCPSIISTKGGITSGLKKHLESRHKKMYLEEVKPKVEARKNGNDVNSINYYENPRKRKNSESQTATAIKFPKNDSQEKAENTELPELMRMLQTLRSHLQTKPGVKSEWFDGLESVLIKEIETERRVHPKAGGTSHFFYAPLDENNCDLTFAPLEPEVQIELLDEAESAKKEENEPKAKQPRISQYFSSSTKLSNDDDFHTSMIKIRSDLF